jgi:hypothetical protein
MIISWWSKHVGVILSVLMCDVWINVLLQTSALVGSLHIVNWNARWNREILWWFVFAYSLKWHSSAETCRRWSFSLIVFYDLYFTYYYLNCLIYYIEYEKIHGSKNIKFILNSTAVIWCFSDRASKYKFVSFTNLMHNSFIL